MSYMISPNAMPKVSVIVPVYNVEPYLQNCIDSLINQTLIDIEIILIDDGSTDNSGKICDEYALQDRRIRVIHKSNEGLSCARNDGISCSAAPYIMFVDSDDWVDSGFCKIAYNAAIDNKADLVAFQHCTVKRGKTKQDNKYYPTGIVGTETALKYAGLVAWNKLYKRELFETIHYPDGRVYEDIAVTHRFILAAKRVIILPDVLYYFRYRNDSISHRCSLKNKRDGFLSALQQAEDLRSAGYEEEIYSLTLCSRALGFLITALHSDDPVYGKAEEIIDAAQEIPAGLTRAKKLMLRIWKVDKRLFHFICRVTGQKDNKSQEA